MVNPVLLIWSSSLGGNAKAFLTAALVAGEPLPESDWMTLPQAAECILCSWLEINPMVLSARISKLVDKGILDWQADRFRIIWDKLTPATILTKFKPFVPSNPAPKAERPLKYQPPKHKKPKSTLPPVASRSRGNCEGADTTAARLFGGV